MAQLGDSFKEIYLYFCLQKCSIFCFCFNKNMRTLVIISILFYLSSYNKNEDVIHSTVINHLSILNIDSSRLCMVPCFVSINYFINCALILPYVRASAIQLCMKDYSKHLNGISVLMNWCLKQNHSIHSYCSVATGMHGKNCYLK